jgi:hypothetical protein
MRSVNADVADSHNDGLIINTRKLSADEALGAVIGVAASGKDAVDLASVQTSSRPS